MIHYFSLPGLSNCFLYLFKLIGSTWPSSLDQTGGVIHTRATVFQKRGFFFVYCLFWFWFFFLNHPDSIKSEGCEVIPAPAAVKRARLPFPWGGAVIYRCRRMKIDLLQVNSQSFAAKGQGESALTASKTRQFRVCACV